MSDHEKHEDGCPDCERMNNALGAIESILDMMMPDKAAAMTVVGATVGLALWKFYAEEDVEMVLKQLCKHAKHEFKRHTEHEMEESMDDVWVKAGGKNKGTGH